ncbi:MAG: hypothetical protein ACE5HI_15525 [bacterium]
MRLRPTACAFVILLIVSGCSPAVRSTAFQSYTPKPKEHPIKIYRTKQPKCPYEEIGIVSSRQRNKLISMEKVMESLKQRAREMGGDAVIGLGEQNETQGAVTPEGAVVLDRDPVLSGTVIRFKEPDCTD